MSQINDVITNTTTATVNDVAYFKPAREVRTYTDKQAATIAAELSAMTATKFVDFVLKSATIVAPTTDREIAMFEFWRALTIKVSDSKRAAKHDGSGIVKTWFKRAERYTRSRDNGAPSLSRKARKTIVRECLTDLDNSRTEIERDFNLTFDAKYGVTVMFRVMGINPVPTVTPLFTVKVLSRGAKEQLELATLTNDLIHVKRAGAMLRAARLAYETELTTDNDIKSIRKAYRKGWVAVAKFARTTPSYRTVG